MRYAVRLLLRDLGFTAIAVGSLALGIGATVLIFSIVQSVLMRSLAYPNSDRLVFVWSTPPGLPEQKRPFTIDSYLALREHTRVLEHVGTVGGVEDTANLGGEPGNLPEQVAREDFETRF